MSTDGFSNAYSTTLNGSIDNSQTSLVVTSATGAPSTVPFRLRIKAEGANTNEIVTVTAVAGTTYTVTRASEAYAGVQSASSHASGAIVEHVLTAGVLSQFVAGYEFDYATSTGGSVTGTTEGTATTVVTANAVTYDGSTSIMLEAYIPYVERSTTGSVNTALYDNGSSIGILELWSQSATTGRKAVYAKIKLTPSAASHTYSIRCWFTGAGSASANGGAGGSGNLFPIFIRQTKA